MSRNYQSIPGIEDMYMKIRQLLLTVFLIVGTGLVLAEDDDICSPFKDGLVDEDLLATMLSAAHDGHLFRIEQSSSRVGFCVDSALKRIKGTFQDFRGGITLDAGANSDGQTMVLIQSDSLDTEGILVRSMLKGENFFDVEDHPEILFVSHSFEWTGIDSALLRGDLTLRGVTRPVTFHVTLTPANDGEGEKITVEATTKIDRAAFGMDKLAKIADNEVQLCISAEAKKYEPVSSREPGSASSNT
jgi:polyisoprenoid-binding protein YceI